MTKKTVHYAVAYDTYGVRMCRYAGKTLKDTLLKLVDDQVVADETCSIDISVDHVADEPLTTAEQLYAVLARDAAPSFVARLCQGLFGELAEEEVISDTGCVTFQCYIFPDGSRLCISHDINTWWVSEGGEKDEEN
jgi:hypothetical protein